MHHAPHVPASHGGSDADAMQDENYVMRYEKVNCTHSLTFFITLLMFNCAHHHSSPNSCICTVICFSSVFFTYILSSPFPLFPISTYSISLLAVTRNFTSWECHDTVPLFMKTAINKYVVISTTCVKLFCDGAK